MIDNLKLIALLVGGWCFIVWVAGLLPDDKSGYRMSRWENQMVCEETFNRVECMEMAK